MELQFRIAGVDMLFDLPEAYIPGDLGVLAPFRADGVGDSHRFSLEMVDALDAPEGRIGLMEPGLRIYSDGEWEYRYIGSVSDDWSGAYLRTAHRGKLHHIQLKKNYSNWIGPKMMMAAMAIEHLAAQNDGFLLHASFIAYQGKAYLFTAPSGTGKSTQADLWVKLRGAELINGDRVCVRIKDHKLYACGIPFAGSSGVCRNETLPLTAVVCLEQAPRTTIRKLSGFQAFRRIWEGSSVNPFNEKDMAAVSTVVQKVVQDVPVYILRCTPDESAVIAVEEMLRE